MLTDEEEQDLLVRAVNGDLKATGKVLYANLRFTVSLSNQYQHKGLSLFQLFEASIQGLADAIMESTAKPQDEKFIKFAVPFMHHSIEEVISSLDNCSKV